MDLYTVIVFTVFASLFLACLLPSRPFTNKQSLANDLIDDADELHLRGLQDFVDESVPHRQPRSMAENVSSETWSTNPVMDLAE